MGVKKSTTHTLVLTLLFLLLDQSSKYLAVKYLPVHKNTGIAFGIQIPPTLLIIINIALLLVVLYLVTKELNFRKITTQIFTAAIFAGGLSNLADRLYHGYVIDFITLPIWPSFNVADILITGGVLLVIIFYGKIKQAK